MSNNSISDDHSLAFLFVAYYPLFLIIVGTICNLITFLILCRSKFRDTTERPTLHYMRVIAIVDILMLYGWNLDHYVVGIQGYTLRTYSIPICKIFAFLTFFTSHISAWLRVFICFDRYLALSRLHRTWFGHSKSVVIIITCICVVFFLFNLHLAIFGCFYNTDGSINRNSRLYTIYPLWSQINLIVYNYIPLICMILLNSGAIYYLSRQRRTRIIQNSRIQHRAISISLILTTFIFLIMTIPTNIAFAYFKTVASEILLNSLDAFFFTYHTLSMVLYLITWKEFRREFFQMIICRRSIIVAPMKTPARQLNTVT